MIDSSEECNHCLCLDLELHNYWHVIRRGIRPHFSEFFSSLPNFHGHEMIEIERFSIECQN